MSLVAEQFNEMCQANLTATRQLASIFFRGTEDMLKATMRTSRKFFDTDTAQLSVAWSAQTSDELVDWGRKYQNNIQMTLDVIQNYFEDTAKTHVKAIHVIHDQIAAAGNGWSQADRQEKNADEVCLHTESEPEPNKPRKVTV